MAEEQNPPRGDGETDGAAAPEGEVQFAIQKIYVKDLSFEAPGAPEIFRSPRWEPEINLQLNSEARRLEGPLYEVVMTLTLTASQDGKTVYLVELQQAGIFHIAGIEGPDLGAVLGAHCPAILFPYAREAISDLVTRGGFPQMLLAPINFDAVYQESLRQRQQQAAGGGEPGAAPPH